MATWFQRLSALLKTLAHAILLLTTLYAYLGLLAY